MRLDDLECLFVDIDNTLYDYEGSVAEHVEAVRGAFPDTLGKMTGAAFHELYWESHRSVPHGEKMRLLGTSVPEYRRRMWAEVLARFDGTIPELDAVVAVFDDLRDRKLRPYDGALNTVKAAAKTMDVGIISNGPGDLQRRKLRSLGVEGIVRSDLVFISHEVGHDKPDARIFERALEVSGRAPERCLMFGDDPMRDLGAGAVGMRTALFAAKDDRKDAPRVHEPDLIVASWGELAERLGHAKGT